jgi:8-oxo-dGTP diphosphatase
MAPRYQNPALAVDAVWIRSGTVLLVRRGRPPFRGFWALPGGFVEIRETVEEALVRELREETGLVGRPLGIVGVYSGPDRDPRKPTTSVAFLVGGRGGAPVGADDAAFAQWVPLAKARPLAFDHGRILKDARRIYRGVRRGIPPRMTPVQNRSGRARPRPHQ